MNGAAVTPDVADSVEAAGAELVVDVVWLVGVADSLVLVEADAETGSDEDEVEGAAVEAGGVVVAVVVEDTAASDVSFAGATIDPMTPMRTNKPTTAPATIAIGCFHHGRFLVQGRDPKATRARVESEWAASGSLPAVRRRLGWCERSIAAHPSTSVDPRPADRHTSLVVPDSP